tara:strand:+ start:1974 stop:2336 length:363 start_codon:yes stop_codon:yes gene_type:complete
MQLNINYGAVRGFNKEAKTLASARCKIGKWNVVIEVFLDYYGTYNTREGINGATPTHGGYIDWREKTNGIGAARMLKEQDDILDKVRSEFPLHGPPNINCFGYLIPLDGQSNDCIGTKAR